MPKKKKKKNVEKVIQRIPRKGDDLRSHKIICHIFKKSQNFRISAAVRGTGNKEARGWCARATVISSTSNPTDAVHLDAAAKLWYVGTY